MSIVNWELSIERSQMLYGERFVPGDATLICNDSVPADLHLGDSGESLQSVHVADLRNLWGNFLGDLVSATCSLTVKLNREIIQRIVK